MMRVLLMLLFVISVSARVEAEQKNLPRRSDVWISGLWTDHAMREAAERLQPTGMTGFKGSTLAHLSPKAREQKLAGSARKKLLAKELGIDKFHFSVHTYHRQPNFPDSAVRIGILGEPRQNRFNTDKAKGKSGWVYCKSHDVFRNAMIENIKTAIDGGADLINLQDFFLGTTYCVCDLCAEKFRNALLHDARLARFREPLGKMDLGDPSQFHIRRYLLDHTKGDERNRRGQFYRMGSLWKAWSAFKEDAAIDFLDAITTAGRTYARQTGREVAFVQHFWYFKGRDLATSDAYDAVWLEAALRHYGGQPSQRNTDDYLLGIAVHPPSGVMGSVASVIRGAGFRCPPIFMGYGGDWNQKLAFKRGPYAKLLQIWTAEVYASGGTMQYLYCLPEKQLLVRDVFKKRRTQLTETFFDRDRSPAEYRCPLDAVGRYTRFIRSHANFYDGCEPPRYVLLLKTERGYGLGNFEENVFAWAQLLDDAHIPYRVLLDGGDRKRVRLDRQTLRGYHCVIALGEPDSYVDAQIEVLKQFTEENGTLVVIGDKKPWQRQLGQQVPVVSTKDLGTRYQLEHRNEALTGRVREVLDARAIETNAGPNVLVKLERSATEPLWRLHLVNRNYRWLEDKVDELKDTHVAIDPVLLMGDADIRDVKAFSPDGSRFAEVHIKTSNEKSTFILPRLSIYTIVTFRTTKQAKGNER